MSLRGSEVIEIVCLTQVQLLLQIIHLHLLFTVLIRFSKKLI